MNMFVRKLVIEEDGEITVSRSFGEGLTVIEGEKRELIQAVLKSVLGYDGAAVVYPYTVRFFAEVQTEETVYIKGNIPEKTSAVELQIYKPDGEDCANDYLHGLQQSAEERSVNCFSDFKRQKYPHRLFRYKDFERYYPKGDFPKRTAGYGATRSFRAFMNQYIKEFRPTRLHNGQNFWLHLMPTGRFAVKNHSGAEAPMLSEAENMVYQYLCFICLAEFWSAAEEIRNFHHIRKPLMVSDFLERLDRTVDVREILDRTDKIKRQVFLFDQRAIV